jgi:hypothetical protein
MKFVDKAAWFIAGFNTAIFIVTIGLNWPRPAPRLAEVKTQTPTCVELSKDPDLSKHCWSADYPLQRFP